LAGGGEVEYPLRQVTAGQVAAAVPWRRARSVRGQAHHPGFYWSATTGTHVIYESRLELARLLVADFDPAVVEIAAQPFLLRAWVGGRTRRHVPDFLFAHADGSARLVNVKPARQLADPKIVEALGWPGRLVEGHGWDYEVWSGDDVVYLANLRFLAGYRRSGLIPGELLEAVCAAVRPGDTVAAVVRRLGGDHPPAVVKAAVLRLLWQRRLASDLHRRLDGDSPLEAGR
jgi:hypothetical protein